VQPSYLQAMSAARSVTHFVAVVSLAAGLAGCGELGYRGAVPPADTQSFRIEPASPLFTEFIVFAVNPGTPPPG